ncbi:MAG: NUDIX hydrolase [Candidatus Hydrogenedentota bacterium]
METWSDSRIVYDGHVVRLRVGEVILDDGAPAYREVVEHKGGVCIVPCDGNTVTLVRQFRIAIGNYVLEAPAGKIESDEDPAWRATCELEEETGFRAGQVIPAGFAYASVGYCTEKIFLFLALDLMPVPRNLDPEERIELVQVPLADVPGLLARNEIPDAKTIIVLHALLGHLGIASR